MILTLIAVVVVVAIGMYAVKELAESPGESGCGCGLLWLLIAVCAFIVVWLIKTYIIGGSL